MNLQVLAPRLVRLKAELEKYIDPDAVYLRWELSELRPRLRVRYFFLSWLGEQHASHSRFSVVSPDAALSSVVLKSCTI